MRKRIKHIFSISKEKKPLDAILLPNPSGNSASFFYSTGFESGDFGGCVSILFPDGSQELLVPKLEEGMAENELKKLKGKTFADVKVFEKKGELPSLLKSSLKGCNNIGVNFSEISHFSYRNLHKILKGKKLNDVSGAISKCRLVKEESEISKIADACKIAQNSLSKVVDSGILEKRIPNVSESEIASELVYSMAKCGASPSFPTICASGAGSANPHHATSVSKIKPNNFLLIDFGARFKKYCSDMTRTFILGKATEKQKRIYETVLEAQQIGIDSLNAGTTASSIHNKIFNFIESTQFHGKFIHSSGHTTGLEVHDGYGLSEKEHFKLEENMVFTIEPGVYLKNFGGVRIEDIAVVQKGRKPKLLTNFSKIPFL